MKKRGVILTEVLIAIAALSIASIVMGSIITDSAKIMNTSRSYFMAQNYANESQQIIKQMVATNWLLYPNFKSSCWLKLDPQSITGYSAFGCSASSAAVTGGVYKITDKTAGAWALTALSSNPPMSTWQIPGTDFYRKIDFVTMSTTKAKVKVTVSWYEGSQVRSINWEFNVLNY